MRSTFMGLETARRGMVTQQSALFTTGHNIANANTPGFSRQRVNFTQTLPYPSIGMNRPQIPGQIGTGVEAGTVQRIREAFLDVQYRTEKSKIGYYGSLSESLTKMEEIMNEPSENGLHSTLEKFWNSLQDLTGHTENTGARDVVAASGQMVADTLNYYFNSLTRVRDDIGSQLDVKIGEMNDIVAQIDHLNQRIAEVEPHGYLPNDLYDERDLLVDQLSKLVNIKVTKVVPNEYGNAKPIADGLYNIEIVQPNGSPYQPSLNLITVTKGSGIIGTNKVELTKDNSGFVTGLKIGNGTITDFSNLSGELGGLIKSFGYQSGSDAKGVYPEMLEKLNTMTVAFAEEFNRIHKNGFILDKPSEVNFKGGDFFYIDPLNPNPAQSIKVMDDILKDPSKIAAGGDGGTSGDNKNAQLLAELKTKSFSKYADTEAQKLPGNFDSYYSGIIGKLGVDSQSAKKDLKNSTILADSVENNRQSVSAVSLDEEMTNMIKFQHAYNAAARNITVVDEMLDKIINGMGVVGR